MQSSAAAKGINKIIIIQIPLFIPTQYSFKYKNITIITNIQQQQFF
jgi:hypothetical protein